MKSDINYILDQLDALFPKAKCELDHKNNFELICAVALSAQTTDISVNKVTPKLFNRYPDAHSLALAEQKEVESCISSLGLYRNKAKNLILMAQKLDREYDGIVPSTQEDLTSLAGVGRKTANVVRSEGFKIPALAVDTHVERVSKRLGLVPKTKDVLETEKILCKKIPQDKWIKAHHQLIFFGRYLCHAQKPECERCPFYELCKYEKKHK